MTQSSDTNQLLSTAKPLTWIVALVLCCTTLPCAAQRRADESRSHVILDPPGSAGPNNVLLQYQLLQQLQQMTRQSGPSPQQLDSLLDGLEPEDIADLAKWAQENIKPDLTGSDRNNLPLPPKLLEQIDARRLAQQLPRSPAGNSSSEPDRRSSASGTRPPTAPRTSAQPPSTLPSGQTGPLSNPPPNQPTNRSPQTSRPTPSGNLPSTSGQPASSSQSPGNNRYAPNGQPSGNSGSRTQHGLPGTDQTQQPGRSSEQGFPSQSNNSNSLRDSMPANPTPSTSSSNAANPARSSTGNTSSGNTGNDSATLRRRQRQSPGTSTTRPQTLPSTSSSSSSESSPADQARKYFQELARDPAAAKQFLEKLEEKSQGATSRSTGDAGSSGTRDASSVPSRGSSSPANNRLPKFDSEGNTSVQDLIRNMSPSDLPPLEEIAKLMPKSGSGNGGVSGPLAEKLKSMVDRDLTKQLDSNGITRTLRGLVNEARKAPPPQSPGSDSGATAGDSLSSGVEKSVLSTLDGLGKSLLGKSDDKSKEQLASKSNGSASNKSPSSNASASRSSTLPKSSAGNSLSSSTVPSSSFGNSGASASEKKEPGLFKSASKALDRWVTRGRSKPDAPSSSSSSNAAAGATLPSELPRLGWLFWLALFAVAGLAALLYLMRKKIPGISSADLGFPLPASALENIRTHADVIQAFHALTFRSPGQAESWWTHRRAAAELSPPDTTLQNAWERLAKLYEEARYHQDRQELSPESAQAAKQALQTLAQAPLHA